MRFLSFVPSCFRIEKYIVENTLPMHSGGKGNSVCGGMDG